MLDAIAQGQLDAINADEFTRARLRHFLHDVARGCLTRRGYVKFTIQWLGRTTTRAQKADLEAAIAAGLVRWPGHTGPNVVAELTDKGREALK
jgi:hypothetical protein